MFLTLLQILNRPWLIEPTQAEYWKDVADKVLFHNQAYPANPSIGLDNWFARRLNANAQLDPKGEVLMLEMQGPLMKYDFCGSPGMETLAQVVEAATADDTISAIIARIDSPGGTVDGTHNLARAIQRSPKATVAFANGYMCSAAYWIGSSFREVISDDANAGYNATIGSIGTMCTIVDSREVESQRKGKIRHVYASKSQRKGKRYNDLMEGKDDDLIKELDALNETFIVDVQANRSGKLKPKLENVLEGEVYDAQAALKFGLIDKIGNLRYAVKRSLQIAKTIKK